MTKKNALVWVLVWGSSMLLSGTVEAAAVRVGLMNSACKPDVLPFHVAVKKNFFADEHIDVSKQDFSPEEAKINDDADRNAARYDLVIAGRALYYYMEATKPGRFKVFSANVNDLEHPDYAIVVSSASKAKGLADVKTIGLEVQSGRAKRVLMTMILEKNGLDPKKFRLFGATTKDLLSGKADALYLREPELTLALETGKLRVLEAAPVVKYVMSPWPMGFAGFSNRFIEKEPEVARKVVAIWDKAVEFIRANPAEARKISRECVKEAYRTEPARDISLIAYWKLGEMDRDVLQKQMTLYFEKGLVPKAIRPQDILMTVPEKKLLSQSSGM